MNFLENDINKLRKISLYLFLVPTLALLLSLILHNILVGFNFASESANYKNKLPLLIKCNQQNNFCLDINFEKTTSFAQCEKKIIKKHVSIGDKKFEFKDYVKKYIDSGNYNQDQLLNLNIEKVISQSKKNNETCIRNTNFLKIYEFFPQPFYLIKKIKSEKMYNAGTSEAIFPFVYGETSISNIAKRYPVNLVFKPLLYIGSILMILYWINYQKIFIKITKEDKICKFTIFGVASSIFLFFHVFFLGTSIDNEIFTRARKIILLLFILSEVIAQFLLTRRLYLSLNLINSLIFKNILKLKIIFVSTIVVGSVIILSILSIYNLDSKVDYILEWNYFLFLLVFYLLSSIMWKKR